MMAFYKSEAATHDEQVKDYGSLFKCYYCELEPYQQEFIWTGKTCHRYYVCLNHVIGAKRARKEFNATEYGLRTLKIQDVPVWKTK